jgi:hypothetical protein
MAKEQTRAAKCSAPVESGISAAIRGLEQVSKALTDERARTKNPLRRIALNLKVKKVERLATRLRLFVFRP